MKEFSITTIADLKECKRNIYIFGVGKMGTGPCYLFLQRNQVEITAFLDNNNDKWNKEIIDNIYCLRPDILSDKPNSVCIILVSNKYRNEIEEQIKQLNRECFIMDEKSIISCIENELFMFSDLKNIVQIPSCQRKKIALYTAVSGNYDDIPLPALYMPNVDYFYISEQPKEHMGPYQWIDMNEVIPYKNLDNRRKGRYCKTHPHVIFPQYDYSIYIDGHIKNNEDIQRYYLELNHKFMATWLHNERDCIYEEGAACVLYQKDDVDVIRKQLKQYFEEGMPRHFGLFATAVILREHNNRICIKIMEEWWKEILTKSVRDQLSLTYVLWKNGLSTQDIGVMGTCLVDSPEFIMKGHNENSLY